MNEKGLREHGEKMREEGGMEVDWKMKSRGDSI